MTDFETIRRVKQGERPGDQDLMGIILVVAALLGVVGLQFLFYGGSR